MSIKDKFEQQGWRVHYPHGNNVLARMCRRLGYKDMYVVHKYEIGWGIVSSYTSLEILGIKTVEQLGVKCLRYRNKTIERPSAGNLKKVVKQEFGLDLSLTLS